MSVMKLVSAYDSAASVNDAHNYHDVVVFKVFVDDDVRRVAEYLKGFFVAITLILGALVAFLEAIG